MNIISIINNKGGVGKTTITQNLGVCMAKKGYKTAVIDFDAQANLSYSIKHTLNKDLGSLLLKKTPISIEDFSSTEYKNLYILPNDKDINSALFGRMNPADQLFALKNILKDLTATGFWPSAASRRNRRRMSDAADAPWPHSTNPTPTRSATRAMRASASSSAAQAIYGKSTTGSSAPTAPPASR